MTTAEPENIIEVENLVTHYGERVILNGINLGIRRGEVMVIMGGSGSGKPRSCGIYLVLTSQAPAAFIFSDRT